MSQKKIIIWSLVGGFNLNLLITWLTFDKIICLNETVIKFISGNKYCHKAGLPISFYFDGLSGFGLILATNGIFWSFIIWLVLMGIRRLRNKKIESGIKY